jgi:hypothetical protein
VNAFLSRIDKVRGEYAEGVVIHIIYVNLALILFFESYTGDYTSLDAALAALTDARTEDGNRIQARVFPEPHVAVFSPSFRS